MSEIAVFHTNWPPLVPQDGFGGQGRTMDAAEEMCGGVIRVPKTGTLKKIGWRIVTTSSPVLSMKVSVETVAEATGQPVATSNAGKTLYAANAESADLTSFSTGIRFDSINGSTWINVSKGDLIAITYRCTAYTSGSISVGQDYGGMLFPTPTPYDTYEFYYLGGSFGTVNRVPAVILEYDDGFALGDSYYTPSPSGTSQAWNSSSNPDRRGNKFKLPYGATLKGAWVYLDNDQNVQLILYDSDEYTVMTGFPITLDADQRYGTAAGWKYVEFPSNLSITKDAWYRIVLLPTITTPNASSRTITPTGDGSYSGMSGLSFGDRMCYTTFNGVPSSGSHAWTDDDTSFMPIALAIATIDFPAGGSGGGPVMGGMVVR